MHGHSVVKIFKILVDMFHAAIGFWILMILLFFFYIFLHNRCSISEEVSVMVDSDTSQSSKLRSENDADQQNQRAAMFGLGC
jgi:hypothetical protein